MLISIPNTGTPTPKRSQVILLAEVFVPLGFRPRKQTFVGVFLAASNCGIIIARVLPWLPVEKNFLASQWARATSLGSVKHSKSLPASVQKFDARRGGIYYSPKEFQNLLARTSKKLDIPSHTIQGMLSLAHQSWQRCFKKLGKKPRLKGLRNRLNSVPFPDPLSAPVSDKIKVPGLGMVRFHKQSLPQGKVKCGQIVTRASGWYLCLFVDAEPASITRTGHRAIGIDPGYKHLITTSGGEKVQHPKELYFSIKRLGQAQRGGNKKLAARLQERIANQRKDRNHKLSRRLVAENVVICFSKDNLRGLSRAGFGKSVAAAAHGQLRSMLAYKSRIGGTHYIEVLSENSTRICSTCGAKTGPQG